MCSSLLLQLDNLSCVRQQKILFSNISLQLTAGELLLIEGPNGSGKSSLLRLIVGLLPPSEGEIFWQGSPIHKKYQAYTEHLHYIGHANGLKLGLTVRENLQLQSLSLSLTKNISLILSQLQLTQNQDTQAKFLSAGQKRRLALAKLFLFPKRLWILDEPLTALDQTTQELFLAQLAIHLQNGGIGMVSSHQSIFLKDTIPIKNLRLGI
ncbi:MAG: heme ABC exporter, ATP-binding protein CcmA [Gammaproteobacteria bacterium RIFCSPHIGHO2_12_FULL_37_14]|nr:MAG: heme ABC exporter, ATP-binding protein CcmA [Gammaproteobacteria bacterium RIFCSPHIGHO2_12_FULL_37_14]